MSLPIAIQSLLYIDYLYLVANIIMSVPYSFNNYWWLVYTGVAFVWNFPTIFVWYVGTETSAKSWEPLFYYRIVKIVIEGGWWLYMIEEVIRFVATGGSGYLFSYTTWTLNRSLGGYWYGDMDDTAMYLMMWTAFFATILDSIMTNELSLYMQEQEAKGFI